MEFIISYDSQHNHPYIDIPEVTFLKKSAWCIKVTHITFVIFVIWNLEIKTAREMKIFSLGTTSWTKIQIQRLPGESSGDKYAAQQVWEFSKIQEKYKGFYNLPQIVRMLHIKALL